MALIHADVKEGQILNIMSIAFKYLKQLVLSTPVTIQS